MNLVLDEAVEVHMKTGKRKTLGRIMLKGDNITLLQGLEVTPRENFTKYLSRM